MRDHEIFLIEKWKDKLKYALNKINWKINELNSKARFLFEKKKQKIDAYVNILSQMSLLFYFFSRIYLGS